MRSKFLWGAIVMLMLLVVSYFAWSQATTESFEQAQYVYQDVRVGRTTELVRKGPSPRGWQNELPPAGVSQVTYPSSVGELGAWLAFPTNASKTPSPVLVYLHGGFAFSRADYEEVAGFLDHGIALMLPTFRGENGNPGDFELFYGEVDDAAAAVRWAAGHENVDPKNIYVFGHSSGGNLAALLALEEDIPVVLTGSAGGLYGESVFYSWRDIAPFNVNNKLEREMRILQPHLSSLRRRHIAYLGREDGMSRYAEPISNISRRIGSPLTIVEVEGDHFTSLPKALVDFRARILEDQK